MGDIPALKHEWDFNLNYKLDYMSIRTKSQGDRQWIMGESAFRHLVTALTGFSMPWTIVSSSSGYVGSTEPGYPGWVQDGLTTHLNSGSWVTLVQSGTTPNVHLCVHALGSIDTGYSLYFSLNHFTGSSPTVAPTSPTAITFASNFWLCIGNSYYGESDQYMHTMQSKDGKHLIHITAGMTGTINVIMVHHMSGHSDTWSTPVVAYALGRGSFNGVSADSLWSDGYFNGTLTSLLGYVSNSAYVGAVPFIFCAAGSPNNYWITSRNSGYNQLTRRYDLLPVCVIGSTNSAQGRLMTRLGSVDDMYVGASALSLGNAYSSDLVHWGSSRLVTPWSGSTIMSY